MSNKLTKAQLIERLTALGVQHDPEQSNKVLQALLDEAEAGGQSAQTTPQQNDDGQPQDQSSVDSKDTDQGQAQGQNSTGQQSGDLPSNTPAISKAEGDTPPESATPSDLVRVVLASDSPVGRLSVAGIHFDRKESGLIPRSEFERLKAEYGLEEVTD